ncbi:MAG TPA: SDR family oxidoreductase [Pyrinomonadaceae bacterium]|nr:SDR family oxidoreductase [Pyrinomonadaceae bacterium]
MSQPIEQVVLITGARKGIGRSLAEHYLDHGYSVVGCSRKESDLRHDRYTHYCLDVSDETSVKNMFDGIATKNGRLDVLINNAGIASMNHVLLTSVDKAREILETNFIGTFLMCREAARLMKKNQFGRIVNLASVATPLKLEGEAVYAASKAAVISFTQVVAKELASFGITVNAIGPTPIDTDLIKSVPEEKLDQLISMQAIKRRGTFADVTNLVDFLIRPESDFITGQVIFLGGV